MGSQTGTVRLRGKVGNITFARTENGDEARLNTSLTGDKMRKSKRFKRTRENWAEFGNAGKTAKLIRKAFALTAKGVSDRLAYSRLVTAALKTVKSDPNSARGKRKFQLGDMSYLLNYEFNENQELDSTFNGQFNLAIDRAAGTVDIDIPEMVPDVAIENLNGATHVKLGAAVAEIDWDAKSYVYDADQSAEIEYGPQIEPAQSFNLTVPAGSTKTIMVVLGIWFYQLVNGQYYLLNDGTRNALSIIGIDNA